MKQSTPKYVRSNSRRPWPDVPRLLQKRREFQHIGDQSVATSVTAFLAWKAFLIVARGSSSGPEKDQCEALVRRMLFKFPELWPTAENFVRTLKTLSTASSSEIADWYADPSLSKKKIEDRVSWARRSIVNMSGALAVRTHTDSQALELAGHAYAVRSAVLAHGAIHSTGNRFAIVVPAFEDLSSQIASAGYAERADIPLSVAFEECHVSA